MAINVIRHFLIGLLLGGILEFVYRSIKQKKPVMPAFANAQMYALAAALLYLLNLSGISLAYKVFFIFLIPSAIEFIMGYGYLKIGKRRLWNYSDQPFNFMGLVCLKFSLYWFVLAAVYYFLL